MNGFLEAASTEPKEKVPGAIVTQPLTLFTAEAHTKS